MTIKLLQRSWKNGGKLSAIRSELQPTEPSLWQAEAYPRGHGNEAGIEPASSPFTIQWKTRDFIKRKHHSLPYSRGLLFVTQLPCCDTAQCWPGQCSCIVPTCALLLSLSFSVLLTLSVSCTHTLQSKKRICSRSHNTLKLNKHYYCQQIDHTHMVETNTVFLRL